MKAKIIFISILLGLVVGCMSPRTKFEPIDSSDTLIIGRLRFICCNCGVNDIREGLYEKYVDLFLKDNSGKKYKIYTDAYGFFFIDNPSFDRFTIRQVRIEDMSYYSYGVTLNKSYSIEKGKVNNLGLLTFKADLIESELSGAFNNEYEDTKKRFSERFSESEWINRDWVNVKSEKK